jgi:hypothetical protein
MTHFPGRTALSGGGLIIEFTEGEAVCWQELPPPGGEVTR